MDNSLGGEFKDEEYFSGFREEIVVQFRRIISEESPARPDDAKPRVLKRRGVVWSPYPKNLKINGNQIKDTDNGYVLLHGYKPARYALYANANSKKPGYIQKAVNKFRAFAEGEGWEETVLEENDL